MKTLLEKIAILLFKHNVRGRGLFSSTFNLHDIFFENSFGLKMRLDPSHYIEREIIINGFYEESVLNALQDALSLTPSPVFWDIGANVGIHCLTLNLLQPDTECYAFEPYCKNFNKLYVNHQLNMSSVHLFNFGLSHDHEMNRIFTTLRNAGRTSFMDIQAIDKTSVNTLSCAGDFLVKQGLAQQPTVIKLDVEGWEMNVLRGCNKLLQNPKLHTIIFEGPTNPNDLEAIDFLQQFGFHCTHMEREAHIIESNENYIATRSPRLTKSSH